jgi:hypothetical protein
MIGGLGGRKIDSRKIDSRKIDSRKIDGWAAGKKAMPFSDSRGGRRW